MLLSKSHDCIISLLKLAYDIVICNGIVAHVVSLLVLPLTNYGC